MKLLLRWLVRLLYRFRAYNVSALDTPGPVLLLPNHVSWWDWLLIGVCLEEDWRFVTSSTTAELSWLHKRIMINRRTFPVDMNSPFAVKHMAEYLQKGGRLVLFPEGRLSCTGSLMKLFDGTGFLILQDPAQSDHGVHPRRRTLALLPDSRPETMVPAGVRAFQRRARPTPRARAASAPPPPARGSPTGCATRWSGNGSRPRWSSARPPCRRPSSKPRGNGPGTSHPAGLHLAGSSPIGVCWRAPTCSPASGGRCSATAGQRVGVLLPNVNAMPVVTFSLWAAGKVPAVLNYSSGPSSPAGLRQARGAEARHHLEGLHRARQARPRAPSRMPGSRSSFSKTCAPESPAPSAARAPAPVAASPI